MYEYMTPERIRQDILDDIKTDQDKREGSQLSDEVAAVALAMSDAYHQLDAMVPSFYLDESSGPYIDKQAAPFGIVRKPGTRARCVLTVTGTPGSVIPEGTAFYTAARLTFLLEGAVVVPESGTGTGFLIAEAVGGAYNIGAGEIVSTIRNYSGIESYTNERADGGSDPETDAALLERYYDYLQKPATSGNAYHYEQWAKEVPGVGACRVFGLHDGPGTVKLVVADSQLTPPGEETVAAVREHVAREMPIGAALTVVGATGLPIDISAKVTLTPGKELWEAATDMRRAVEAWLAEETRKGFSGHINCQTEPPEDQGWLLTYTRVGYLLLSVPGVVDFADLTVNGSTANVKVAADQVAVVGEVSLT